MFAFRSGYPSAIAKIDFSADCNWLPAFILSWTPSAETRAFLASVTSLITAFSCFMYPLTEASRFGIRSERFFSWTEIWARALSIWCVSRTKRL